MSRKSLRVLVGVAVLAATLPCSRAQQVPLQDKPFAEHKIVLQLSDNDVRKQNLVISVANNLLKFYDPDKVAIEVVAFGPGIESAAQRKPRRKQVESLIAQGVRFECASIPSTPSSARPAGGRRSCRARHRCRSASGRYCFSPKTDIHWSDP